MGRFTHLVWSTQSEWGRILGSTDASLYVKAQSPSNPVAAAICRYQHDRYTDMILQSKRNEAAGYINNYMVKGQADPARER